jgi:hypothetical protein
LAQRLIKTKCLTLSFHKEIIDLFLAKGLDPGIKNNKDQTYKNYVVMPPAKKIALVFFSTQKTGAASIAAYIARHIIGDTYSPLYLMGYH